MPGFRTALHLWQRRRASLAEEWRFHQERVVLELIDAGLTEPEARTIAAERLGPKSRYQAEAYADSGADWKGLLQLAAPHPVPREAWTVPAVLVLGLILLFGLNPFRHQVVAGLFGPVHVFQESIQAPRWAQECGPGFSFVYLGSKTGPPDACVVSAPWVKEWRVPAGFAQIGCLIGLMSGLVWLTMRARSQHLTKTIQVYAVTTLAAGAVLGGACYSTCAQWLLVGPGPSGFRDSWGIVGLWFLWGPSYLLLLQLWRRDITHRCPWCLERLQWPVEHGDVDSVLLNPTGVESVCLSGHGTLTDTRWGDEFRESGQFWEDLERDQWREGFSASPSEYSKE